MNPNLTSKFVTLSSSINQTVNSFSPSGEGFSGLPREADYRSVPVHYLGLHLRGREAARHYASHREQDVVWISDYRNLGYGCSTASHEAGVWHAGIFSWDIVACLEAHGEQGKGRTLDTLSQSGGKRHLGMLGRRPCFCSKLHSGISFDPEAIDFFLAAFY